MANTMSIRVDIGTAEIARLLEALKQMGQAVANRAARKAVNAATKPVLQEARRRVPVRHRLLKKALGRKVNTYRNTAVTVGIVGARKGFKTVIDGVAEDPVKYAHLVEFGRKAVKAKPGRNLKIRLPGGVTIYRKSARAAAARPFLRPAYDLWKDRMPRLAADSLRADLAKYGVTP